MNNDNISNVTDSFLEDKSVVCTFQPDDESPFPVDALPSPLKEMAESVSSAYQAPMNLVAPQTLAVVSACLGKGVCLRTNHPDPTYGLLYMFLATRAAVAKSTISKCLLKPVKEYQKCIRESYKLMTEARLKIEYEDKANGGAAKRPKARDVEDEIEKSLPTLIAEHYTQEGLANTLSYNDEYLALVSTDASGVIDLLRGSKSNGNFQGEILLKGYSGESYDCNNKNAKNEHLEEIRLSINWLATNDTLKTFVSDPLIDGRGLLSRFLFAEIDERVPLATIHCEVVDNQIEEDWSQFLTVILAKYWNGNKDSVDEVQMSKEAIQKSVEFRNEFVGQQDMLEGIMSLGSRWGENTCRLALLLHVSKHYNDPANHELTEHTMGAAIRIMRWFAGRELSCLEDVTNYDPTIMECKGRVFKYLGKNGPSTMRVLQKSAGLKKSQRSLIHNWVRQGELVMWNASQGNKPSPTFALIDDNRIPENAEFITNP